MWKVAAGAWPLLVLVLAACAGASRGTPKDLVTIPPPRPLDVSVTLDASRSLSATIPTGGGTVSATAADGTVYTLSIPANALASETLVTMTPIVGVQGGPISGGRMVGVELKPHGLRLYDFATLTIAPPEGEPAQAVAFASQGDGKDFYLHPLSLEPGLKLELLHFSDYGAYLGSETDPIVVVPEPGEVMPLDWESQLAQMTEELIRREREAQRRGEPGDPQFGEKLTAILNTFYIQVVSPLLGRIATDCNFAKANNAKVLSWSRQVALLGLDATFASETSAVWDAVRKGMDNCWKKAIEPCINQSDAEQFGEVVGLARINILLGGSEETYNPFDPELQCDCADVAAVEAWQGSISYSHSRDVASESNHVIYELDVKVDARLEERNRNENAVGFFGAVPGGSVSLSSEEHSHGEEHRVEVTFDGSGPPVPWDALSGTGSNMSLSILLSDCSYSFYLGGAVAGTWVFSDGSSAGQSGFNPIRGAFDGASLSISGSAEFPVYSPSDIEASTDKPVWFAERYDVADILGWENLGTVFVSWTFTPAQAP